MSDLLTEMNAPVKSRELPYVPEGRTADLVSGGSVGRGVNRKAGADGGKFLIFQADQRTQQAVPMRAVAQAIYSGVITRDEIAKLHAAADKDKK
jgi:hypothetical protein